MYETGTVFPSAARTASPTPVVLEKPANAKNLILHISATAASATPSVVVSVRAVNPLNGNVGSVLLAAAAITGITEITLRLGPGVAAVANLAGSTPLPAKISIDPVHGDSDSLTYSISYEWVD